MYHNEEELILKTVSGPSLHSLSCFQCSLLVDLLVAYGNGSGPYLSNQVFWACNASAWLINATLRYFSLVEQKFKNWIKTTQKLSQIWILSWPQKKTT